MSKSSKQKNIDAILEACIELEVTKGHLKWRFSDLSRISGVTRTLIYYYFGDSKEALLTSAAQYFADEFLDVRFQNIQRIRKGDMADLIKISRARLRKSPYFLQFYAKHRLEETEINRIFAEAEKNYFENMTATLPVKWRSMARVLWALLFGLTMQPGITDADIRIAERILQRAWPKR